ncbi:MAG: hypothetical protein L6R43_16685 [Planctomycetes bacterium]|nr:hypothetical protein [Planctomycetota bacterium]
MKRRVFRAGEERAPSTPSMSRRQSEDSRTTTSTRAVRPSASSGRGRPAAPSGWTKRAERSGALARTARVTRVPAGTSRSPSVRRSGGSPVSGGKRRSAATDSMAGGTRARTVYRGSPSASSPPVTQNRKEEGTSWKTKP